MTKRTHSGSREDGVDIGTRKLLRAVELEITT
jgi:hypothetical protein